MRRWPDIRAGLLAATIFFGLVDGCPLPTPDATPAWERDFVETVRSAQHFVETPVAWIGRTLRFSQWWALYQHPAGPHHRLWIDGQSADGAWHLLYRAGDSDHSEDSDVIETSRVWGTYSPTDATPPSYGGFCHWITTRALARHPEFVAVRTRLEKVDIDRGMLTAKGTFQDDCVHPRGIP